MEKSYQSLSLFEFQQRFTTNSQCLAYLLEEKWKNGYACSKCGHNIVTSMSPLATGFIRIFKS